MMKTVPLTKTTLPANLKGCLTALGLTLFLQFSARAAVTGDHPGGGRDAPSCRGSDTIHSIQVSKAQSSKKIKIRLYPDARQQVLFFSANGQDGKVYQLFLFEVFTDDERIENGQVTVR